MIAVLILVQLMASCSLTPVHAATERYEIACRTDLWQMSLDVAKSQNGVREKTGRNDGPQIRAYLASVNLPEGNPYCQGGQYWSFAVACDKLSIDRTNIPLLRTGSTQAAFNDVRRRGRRTECFPKVGDLITYTCATNRAQGHVERIIAVLAGGWIRDIAFNIGTGGTDSARDGGGVGVRLRNWLHPNMRMLVRGFTGHYNPNQQHSQHNG